MIDPNAGELIIRQRYPHGVEDVFRAWSDLSQIRSWWGPKNFTATEFEGTFREGADWRAVIVGPDGEPYGQSGRYTRIVPNALIAFTFQWDWASEPPETDVTVTFEDEGNSTLLTFTQSPFSSVESRKSHEGGWQECLDRLGGALKERQP